MLRILVFLFTLFSSTFAISLDIAHKEISPIRGVQLFVLPDSDLDEYFTSLRALDINTIFLRVFHNDKDRVHMGLDNPCPSGGVYYRTTHACVVKDILKDFIPMAHKYGISVYGWMATRSLSFLKDIDTSLSFTPRGIERGYGANILNPLVADKLRLLILDLAKSGVAGILIQDDFIYKYSEGADHISCALFRRDTGIRCSIKNFFIDASGSKLFDNRGIYYDSWISWKADKIYDYLSDIRKSVRLINPNIKWGINIYYETPVYPDKALSWYSQELSRIWDSGMDYIAVMAYEEQIKEELKIINDTSWNKFLKNLVESSIHSVPDKNPDRVIFKIQVKSFKTGEYLPIASIRSTCDRVYKYGGKSIVQLPVNSLFDIYRMCDFR